MFDVQPTNELETEISSILKASGMASEKDIQRGEELALNKLDPEEVPHYMPGLLSHTD